MRERQRKASRWVIYYEPCCEEKKIQIFSFSCKGASWWVLHRSGKFTGSWIRALLGRYLFLQLYGGASCFKSTNARLSSSVWKTRDLLISKDITSPFCKGLQLFPLLVLLDTAGNCSAQRHKPSCPTVAAPKAQGQVIFKPNAGLKPNWTANIYLEQEWLTSPISHKLIQLGAGRLIYPNLIYFFLPFKALLLSVLIPG